MTARELQRQAIREAAMQDAAVGQFEAELRRVVRRLTSLLRAALEDFETDDTGRTVTSVANLARVFALRRKSRALLKQSGFDQLALFAVGDPLDELAASILAAQGVSQTLGPSVVDTLAAWKEFRLADLLDIADDAARAIQRIALDGTLGLRPVDRMIQDVSKALDLSFRLARTQYDTAVSMFARQVEQVTSDGTPGELFLYVGPVDGKTREFCLERVGRVYSRAEIDKMDNGSLPNVFITGGSYNCRHTWKRVSRLDDEIIALHDTGERAPGIEAALKRAEAA